MGEASKQKAEMAIARGNQAAVEIVEATENLAAKELVSATERISQLASALNTTRENERKAKNELEKYKTSYSQGVQYLERRDKELSRLHPALHKTVRKLDEGHLKVRPGQLKKLPVLALRWSHNAINSGLAFGNDASMLLAFDHLIRGIMGPDQWVRGARGHQDRPDVVEHQGEFYVVTANRRLLALMMFQALRRTTVIEVLCNVRDLEEPRWNAKFFGGEERDPAWSTTTRGLDIQVGHSRNKTSTHFGYDLFATEKTAYDVFLNLFQGAPEQLKWLKQEVECSQKSRQSNYADEWQLLRKRDRMGLRDIRDRMGLRDIRES